MPTTERKKPRTSLIVTELVSCQDVKVALECGLNRIDRLQGTVLTPAERLRSYVVEADTRAVLKSNPRNFGALQSNSVFNAAVYIIVCKQPRWVFNVPGYRVRQQVVQLTPLAVLQLHWYQS